MKLVNPVGRDKNTFETQAYRCICSTGPNFEANHRSGFLSSTRCQCSGGQENRVANRNSAGPIIE